MTHEELTEMHDHMLLERLIAHAKMWGVDEFKADFVNAEVGAMSVRDLSAEVRRRLGN